MNCIFIVLFFFVLFLIYWLCMYFCSQKMTWNSLNYMDLSNNFRCQMPMFQLVLVWYEASWPGRESCGKSQGSPGECHQVNRLWNIPMDESVVGGSPLRGEGAESPCSHSVLSGFAHSLSSGPWKPITSLWEGLIEAEMHRNNGAQKPEWT